MRLVFHTILLLTLFSATTLPEAVVSQLKTKAGHGDLTAQKELGKRYRAGDGVAQDPKLSFYWYSLAAAAGDIEAMTELGLLYYEGKGIEKDFFKAEELWYQAALLGNPWAQLHLARLFDPDNGLFFDGRGIGNVYGRQPTNQINSEEWYTKAAEQGLARAQVALASFYMFGWGNQARPMDQALKWLRQAAEQRNAVALYELGMIAETPNELLPGTDMDAYMWFTLADHFGYIHSVQADLARLSSKLSANEIEEAEAGVTEWLKHHAEPSGRRVRSACRLTEQH